MTRGRPVDDPGMSGRRERCSESFAVEISVAGAVVGSRAGRHLIERLGMQTERVVDHARVEHIERGRSGHDDGLRRRIDFAHDRRRVVGSGNGDDEVPGRDAAIAVVDRDRVGQRQDLALSPDNRTRSTPPRTTGRPTRTWSRRPWSPSPGVTSAISAASSSARPVVAPDATASRDGCAVADIRQVEIGEGDGNRRRQRARHRSARSRFCCAMSAMTGASLLPLTVTTMSCEVTPPWWSSTSTV